MTIKSVDAAGGQTRGPGQAAGYVWECGEPSYGARVGPGWYRSGTGVARGCQVPFPVLRMLMQSGRKPPQSHTGAKAEGRMKNAEGLPKPPQSHIRATSEPPQSVLVAN